MNPIPVLIVNNLRIFQAGDCFEVRLPNGQVQPFDWLTDAIAWCEKQYL